MSENYALIIGVQEYRGLDEGGDKDIPGACNDAWIWFQTCLSMGLDPANIRVLTTPVFEPSQLGPHGAEATLGKADRAGIAAGLQWLARCVDKEGDVSGLLTFTGHGDKGKGKLAVLCPSDTTASHDNMIHLADLEAASSDHVRDNVTMMLDCCHSGAGLDTDGSGDDRHTRVIAACGRDQTSVSSQFLGKPMGAFTWAMTSVIGQWRAGVENRVVHLDLSYGKLQSCATKLLEALQFPQTPVLSGPAGVEDLAFLQAGKVVKGEDTKLYPSAARPLHQLDPDYYVLLASSDGKSWHMAATVHSQAAGPTDMAVSDLGKETWIYSSEGLQALKYASQIKLERVRARQCSVSVDWGPLTPSPKYACKGSVDKVFHGAYPSSATTLAIGFTFDPLTQTSISHVTWFNPTATNIHLTATNPRVDMPVTLVDSQYDGSCYVVRCTMDSTP